MVISITSIPETGVEASSFQINCKDAMLPFNRSGDSVFIPSTLVDETEITEESI